MKAEPHPGCWPSESGMGPAGWARASDPGVPPGSIHCHTCGKIHSLAILAIVKAMLTTWVTTATPLRNMMRRRPSVGSPAMAYSFPSG
jgi:hypothetical protein